MAMGDLLAFEFAQGSHLALLLQASVIHPTELIQLKHTFPRGNLFAGIVVDDLVMLEKVVRKMDAALEPTRLAPDRMKKAVEAYRSVHLPLNDKKAFPGVTQASFWGIELDGVAGSLRASSTRLWPLVMITMRVCALGVTTLGLLESMVGSWLSILIVRRRLLCILSTVYKALHAGGNPGSVIRMSDALKDELITFCVLAPLACVNLRASVLHEVFCTDALNWGTAAVSAPLPSKIVTEFTRHAAWLRLKGALDPSEELPGEDCYDVPDVHPLWELVARCLNYKEVFRKKHVSQVRINVGELRGFLQLKRRLCREHRSFRWLSLLDSQVSLGALVKGRAASQALNAELRKNVPYILGADASDSHFYVPSKLNRADAPTRDAEVPPPDVPGPVWFDQLLQDYFSGFDAWIASLPSPDGNSVPDFQQLIKPLHVRIKQNSVALEFQKSAKQLRHGDVISAFKKQKDSDSCPP